MIDPKIIIALAGITGASFLFYNYASVRASCLPSLVTAPKVVLLGDSITGTVSYRQTVKQSLLQKYPGAQITTLSYPGKGLALIGSQGLERALLSNPDLVVLLGGVNDLASGRPAHYVKAQLNAIYTELNDHHIAVAAVQLTPWNTHIKGRKLQLETEQVNEFIRRHPIPCSVVRTAEIRGLATDGLHLTRSGGIELAKSVLKDALGVI
jgi:lysophospholipase L1-like esterase